MQRSVIDVGVGDAAGLEVPDKGNAPKRSKAHAVREHLLGTLLVSQRQCPSRTRNRPS